MKKDLRVSSHQTCDIRLLGNSLKQMPRNDIISDRRWCRDAKRIVIKIGSRVLVQPTGRPDRQRIGSLVKQIAVLQQGGRQVVLVSSGAIAAGVEALGMKTRPTNLPELQMAAAVGQVQLMSMYERLFAMYDCRIGQVLLTHNDLEHRIRHLNARNTMMELLRTGIIPVINENDVIAVDEIKFGDNDVLAALVSVLVGADLMLLLSTTDGLQERIAGAETRRIAYLPEVTGKTLSLAEGKGSEFSSGGMASKLQSAQVAVEGGSRVVIADGRMERIIGRVIEGEDLGTVIGRPEKVTAAAVKGRKRWLAFFHKTSGTLVVDNGARKAIEEGGHSLLPIGIKTIEGTFESGSLVNVKSLDGTLIARGLVVYSSEEIGRIKGRRTSEIESILGSKDYDEVIHRDNMVVLTRNGQNDESA